MSVDEGGGGAAHRHGRDYWHRHDDVHGHGHDHKHEVVSESRFVSVGIDIGSSTTHLMLSQLVVGRLDSHLHGKPEVLSRKVVYRSPVMFTPFVRSTVIDHEAVASFLRDSYSEAGIAADQVDTGAVICTGEAARKENSQRVTQALAADSGRFVCATAGHHFEAVLAANGSGSVEASHHLDGRVASLDIGGGTTKLSWISKGLIETTYAINVGGRLIAVDADGEVVRSEPAGRAIAASLGIDCSPGRPLGAKQQQAIASTMARVLIEFLGFEEMSPLAQSLLLDEAPRKDPGPFWLICSGGVSEFVYGRSDMNPGDLGPVLGNALREQLNVRLPAGRLLLPREGIRATVIGASQFSLQASGETVFVSDLTTLPLSNVPVYSVPIDWEAVSAQSVKSAICSALAVANNPERFALFFGGPRLFGYSAVAHVARGIADASAERPQLRQAVFVFSHNIANTVGHELTQVLGPGAAFVCLDEIEVSNLDYLDIGNFPPEEPYLPVIVKSLVFGAGHRHGPDGGIEWAKQEPS